MLIASCKTMFKPLAFQVRMVSAEYLLCPRQDARHSKLLTRADSNHCPCAEGLLGVFLIKSVWVMCYFLSLIDTHFQRASVTQMRLPLLQHLI